MTVSWFAYAFIVRISGLWSVLQFRRIVQIKMPYSLNVRHASLIDWLNRASFGKVHRKRERGETDFISSFVDRWLNIVMVHAVLLSHLAWYGLVH